MTVSRRDALALGASLAAAGAMPVRAQSDWPARSLRILVGTSPGGSPDIVSRLLADKFAARLGQSITVENNGLGRFLPGLLRAEMAKARMPCAVIERPSTRSKAERILAAFEPLLAARRLWAHRSVFATPLIAEMHR